MRAMTRSGCRSTTRTRKTLGAVVRARRDALDISQADFVRRNLCFYCHVFENKHCHKTVGPCTPQHYIHFVTERLCTPMLCRYIAPEPAGEAVVSDLVHCSHCNYMSMNDNELYIPHAVRSMTECIKLYMKLC